MKQQIIELKKKILLVELPEDYVVVSVFPPKRTLTMWNENGQYITEKLDFDVDEIGKLTDIKEEQFAELVEYAEIPILYDGEESFQFKNYQFKKLSDRYSLTAQESFFTALQANKIYFENPFGEYPTKHNTGLPYGMEYIDKQARWEEAQESVWDKDRCYLFEIQ